MIFEYFEHDLARYMHDAGPLSDRRALAVGKTRCVQAF